MKIAVVTSGHVPSQWAHSINTLKHANAFAKLGHETEVFTMERFKEANLKKKVKDIYRWYGINKIPIHYFKDNIIMYYKEAPYLRRLVNVVIRLSGEKVKSWKDPEKEAIGFVKEKNFDLCFCRAYNAVKYSIEAGIPVVIESHCPKPEKVPEIIELVKYSKNSAFKGIVTIHEKLKENFIQLGFPSRKILVQEDAVDIELFGSLNISKSSLRKDLELPLDRKIIMYCGSLKKGKGISKILETAEALQVHKDIQFIVVGGTSVEVDKWKEGIWSKKLRNVKFVGYVAGDVVPKYLKSADVLIMPYDVTEKDKIMDIETTSPIKLFEYMASGVPIVTTNIPTITKVLNNNETGVLVDLHRQDYANKILYLVNNHDVSIEMGRRASLLAKQYSYTNRCENILSRLCKE